MKVARGSLLYSRDENLFIKGSYFLKATFWPLHLLWLTVLPTLTAKTMWSNRWNCIQVQVSIENCVDTKSSKLIIECSWKHYPLTVLFILFEPFGIVVLLAIWRLLQKKRVSYYQSRFLLFERRAFYLWYLFCVNLLRQEKLSLNLLV